MANKKLSPPPTDAPPAVAVARFDAGGVYQGIETIDAAAVTPAHVLLPDGCDLPPNKYFWHAERGCFWPLIGTAEQGVNQ